jgi:hypothetical protein
MSGDDRGDLRDHRKKQHFYLSTESSSGGSSYGRILKLSSLIEKSLTAFQEDLTYGLMAICPYVDRGGVLTPGWRG